MPTAEMIGKVGSGACRRCESMTARPHTTLASTAIMHAGIGDSVRRKEDLRLLTGRGRYSDDFNLPGQAYARWCAGRMPTR